MRVTSPVPPRRVKSRRAGFTRHSNYLSNFEKEEEEQRTELVGCGGKQSKTGGVCPMHDWQYYSLGHLSASFHYSYDATTRKIVLHRQKKPNRNYGRTRTDIIGYECLL